MNCMTGKSDINRFFMNIRPFVACAVLFLMAAFFYASQAYSTVYTNFTDPIDNFSSTRALGMGRAYVAAANDVGSIFLNPAGLAYAKSWGWTLGATSIVKDTSNVNFGIYYSLSNEAFGFGFIDSNTWNPEITSSREPIIGRYITVEGAPLRFGSGVGIFSYGVNLHKYLDFPILNDTSIGISLKTFSQQVETSEEVFSGSGFDIDLGLIYKMNSWLKLGLLGQNILQKESGGKMVWTTAYEEPIPVSNRYGISAKILGPDGMLDYGQDVYLNYEYEEGSYKKDNPSFSHGGIEWWLNSNLAIRSGLDQLPLIEADGDFSIEDNYTCGFGYRYQDFTLDYAYHKYGDDPDNTLHYFSLSYVLPAETLTEGAPLEIDKIATVESTSEAMPEKAIKLHEYLIIKNPADRSVIHGDSVALNASVNNADIARVYINDEIYNASGEVGRVISASVETPYLGKTSIKIKCIDEKGNLLREYGLRLVKMASFLDVQDNSRAGVKIGLLATLGIMGGYPDGTFKPEKIMTRGEFSELAASALGLPTPEAIANPSAAVNRADGITIIARLARLSRPQTVTDKPFPDISKKHWAAKSIIAAKKAGLLWYLIGKPFEPKKVITRAEAAMILSQTRVVKDKEAELFNWEAGFE